MRSTLHILQGISLNLVNPELFRYEVNATRHITATINAKGNIGKMGTDDNANECKTNTKRNRQHEEEKSRNHNG